MQSEIEGTVLERVASQYEEDLKIGDLECMGFETVINGIDLDDLDDDYDSDEVISSWQPEKPNGDGWLLAWKTDTDDGPAAVWVRPSAGREDIARAMLRPVGGNALDNPCALRAHPDEPVFVLRGQDKSAPKVVEYWAFLNKGNAPGKAEGAQSIAEEMRAWHFHKDATD